MHFKFDKDSISVIASVFQTIATILSVLFAAFEIHFKATYEHRYANRKQQLNKVYSPLYFLSEEYLNLLDFTYADLESFVKKAKRVITSNRILTSCKTRRYIFILQRDVKNRSLNAYHADRCKREIAREYYKLRKNLYYSADSFFFRIGRSKFYNVIFSFYAILFLLFFIAISFKAHKLFVNGKVLGGLAFSGIACIALIEVCIVIKKLKM